MLNEPKERDAVFLYYVIWSINATDEADHRFLSAEYK